MSIRFVCRRTSTRGPNQTQFYRGTQPYYHTKHVIAQRISYANRSSLDIQRTTSTVQRHIGDIMRPFYHTFQHDILRSLSSKVVRGLIRMISLWNYQMLLLRYLYSSLVRPLICSKLKKSLQIAHMLRMFDSKSLFSGITLYTNKENELQKTMNSVGHLDIAVYNIQHFSFQMHYCKQRYNSKDTLLALNRICTKQYRYITGTLLQNSQTCKLKANIQK